MADIIIILVVALACLAAALYVRRAKSRGQKCIGCPGGCKGGDDESSCSACGGCSHSG